MADGNCAQVCGIAEAARALGRAAVLCHHALSQAGDTVAAPARCVTRILSSVDDILRQDGSCGEKEDHDLLCRY